MQHLRNPESMVETMRFSSRVDISEPNPIAKAEAEAKANGITLGKLNDSNPTISFCFLFIVESFINIFRIKLAHSVGKLLCVHTNTSLSIKYCFIFSRIRVNRTEMFFSESPANSAMSV